MSDGYKNVFFLPSGNHKLTKSKLAKVFPRISTTDRSNSLNNLHSETRKVYITHHMCNVFIIITNII